MDCLSMQAPHLFGPGREPQRASPTAVRDQRPAKVVDPRPHLPMRPVTHIRGEVVLLLPVGDLVVRRFIG